MFAPLARSPALSTACLIALAACGDGDELPPRDAPDAAASLTDGGVADASTGPTGPQVENAGAACTRDDECRGADATCLTAIGLPPLGVSLPAGYCTASCESSDDCGSGGGCPVGDLLNGPPFSELLADPALKELVRGILPLTSMCWDRCGPFGLDPCRPGYVCQATRDLIPPELNEQLGLLLFLPAFWNSYCMPPVELPSFPDAGRPDAGMIDAGVDAGPTDAGVPDDAATADAAL